MKILITGGAGFIGTHLVKKLLKEDCEIVILDNLHTGRTMNLCSGIRFIEMDVRDMAIKDFFEKERFDIVVHLAGQTTVTTSLDMPYFDADVNIVGGINILEACRSTGVKRIVFSSSAAVYGDASCLPLKETHVEISNCTSFYGLSKLTFEKYLQLYSKNFKLEYVTLRFSNVYGEYQSDEGEGGVVSIFSHKIAKNEAIQVFNDGNQTRDFIYAGDVAIAIWSAMQTCQVNNIYNISSRNRTSINELMNIFEEISGKNIQKEFRPPRIGEIYHSSLDNEKAINYLDWKPRVSLKDGLAATYKFFAKGY